MSEFVVGQWVECVDADTSPFTKGKCYRVASLGNADIGELFIEGFPGSSWLMNRFRPVEWEVGKEYKTTLDGVTATIETIGNKAIIGKGSNAFLYRCEWHPQTGRMLDLERVDDVPHLTPYLADEPSPAVETTEPSKSAEPQPTLSRYHRTINGATLDLYDLADAYDIKSHRIFHAVKKLVLAGRRGHKDREQDLREAIVSIESELQKMKGGAS